jgi:adenine specific DNA methylase Mod
MFEGLKAIREEIENATITNPDRDEIRDGYQLRFVGKDYAKFVSTLPTETMLVPDTDWNNKAENKDSQNIFITGDNLDALKHLVNAYERQIKCIYIDPPYNTGSDGFVYNDTFNFTDA